MFEVSFFQASRLNSFFLLVSALWVWLSALCKLLIGWDLCWDFVFPLMGKAEWGGNPVCWWLGLHFCLLFRWGVLQRVLMVVGWCQVLYYSGFLCMSYHYLIPLRVSYLVIQGLKVSAPTQKLRTWSRVLSGSIYSFWLATYSCQLSAGVLHALLCLNM